jgi:hypothetical protein
MMFISPTDKQKKKQQQQYFCYIYQKSYIYTKQTRISRENREYNTIFFVIIHVYLNVLCVCVYVHETTKEEIN